MMNSPTFGYTLSGKSLWREAYHAIRVKRESANKYRSMNLDDEDTIRIEQITCLVDFEVRHV